MRLVLISLLLIACAAQTHAQSSRKNKKKKASREASGPTTLDPYSQQQEYRAPKASRKSKSGPTYNAERAYYERQEDLQKQKQKDAKEMAKPQYSDPMYFGHKKPPKKRPPNKMKLCKVCGIRH